MSQRVRDEGAVQDLALLQGDKLSPVTTRSRGLPLSSMPSLTIRSLSVNGKGSSKAALTMLNSPVAAAIPTARETTAVAAKPGLRRKSAQRIANILPAVLEPHAPPHVPDSVLHLPDPTELQSCRPSRSGVLHAGCAIFVNQ